MKSLDDLSQEISVANKEKGWWDRKPGSDDTEYFAAKLALVHSEVSEALEELRAGRPLVWQAKDGTSKPEGALVELADVVIRVLDLVEQMKAAGASDVSFQEIVENKMAYNKSRSHRHGKKI